MRIAVKYRDVEPHFLNSWARACWRVARPFSSSGSISVSDFQPRIQTGERILKYHLDILTHPLLLLAPGLQDVITMETNMTGLCGPADKTATGGRFTAA